jgi:hypothetical protein
MDNRPPPEAPGRRRPYCADRNQGASMIPTAASEIAMSGFELDALWTRPRRHAPGDRKWAKTQFKPRLRHVRLDPADLADDDRTRHPLTPPPVSRDSFAGPCLSSRAVGAAPRWSREQLAGMTTVRGGRATRTPHLRSTAAHRPCPGPRPGQGAPARAPRRRAHRRVGRGGRWPNTLDGGLFIVATIILTPAFL